MAVEPDQLRSCSLFASLGHEELEPLCDWFEVASVSEGVAVAGEGAPGYSFFVIRGGQRRRQRRRRRPGDARPR